MEIKTFKAESKKQLIDMLCREILENTSGTNVIIYNVGEAELPALNNKTFVKQLKEATYYAKTIVDGLFPTEEDFREVLIPSTCCNGNCAGCNTAGDQYDTPEFAEAVLRKTDTLTKEVHRITGMDSVEFQKKLNRLIDTMSDNPDVVVQYPAAIAAVMTELTERLTPIELAYMVTGELMPLIVRQVAMKRINSQSTGLRRKLFRDALDV